MKDPKCQSKKLNGKIPTMGALIKNPFTIGPLGSISGSIDASTFDTKPTIAITVGSGHQQRRRRQAKRKGGIDTISRTAAGDA